MELRSKSIERAKNELEYQEEMEKKVKQMAKLQKKLDGLSLDDSREAAAEKKKLNEEMRDLQLEINKTQRDEAIEKQQDSLDQQDKA